MTGNEAVEEVALRINDPAGTSVAPRILYRLVSRAARRVAEETACYRVDESITLSAAADRYEILRGRVEQLVELFQVVHQDTQNVTADVPYRAANRSAPNRLSYYVEGPRVPSGEGQGRRFLRLRPVTDVFNVTYDPAVHAASGAILRLYMSVTPPDVADGDTTELVLPRYAHEAVMLEAAAEAALLATAPAGHAANLYRQRADRAIGEVRRRTADSMGGRGYCTPTSF